MMKYLEALTGIWKVISAVRDGENLSDEQIKDVRVTFDRTGISVVMKGVQAPIEFKVKIDATREPKTEDATQISEGRGKGETALSVYKIDGDTLTICSAELGRDRPTEFSSRPGSGHFLRVFKKENE